MEERFEKYLPLGSICLLKGAERYLMVSGYLGMNGNNIEDAEVFDYLGILFPVGVISSEVSLMFNHDQIDKVIFKGFENEESKKFLEEIKGVSKEEVINKVKEMMNGTNKTPTEVVAPRFESQNNMFGTVNTNIETTNNEPTNNEPTNSGVTTTPFGGIQ